MNSSNLKTEVEDDIDCTVFLCVECAELLFPGLDFDSPTVGLLAGKCKKCKKAIGIHASDYQVLWTTDYLKALESA